MSPFCHIHKRQRIVNGQSIKLLYKNKDLEKIRIEKELMEKLAKKIGISKKQHLLYLL